MLGSRCVFLAITKMARWVRFATGSDMRHRRVLLYCSRFSGLIVSRKAGGCICGRFRVFFRDMVVSTCNLLHRLFFVLCYTGSRAFGF